MSKYVPLLLAVLVGCGGRPKPPTLAEQRAEVERSSEETPEGWARVGWWRYLSGDGEGAATAFERAADVPLGALGRAQLARDRLDDVAVFAETETASQGGGIVGLVALTWRTEAARRVPKAIATPKSTVRISLTGAIHTVRISFLPHLSMRQLQQSTPQLKPTRVHLLGKWWALDQKTAKPDVDGLIVTRWALPSGPQHIELQAAGPVVAWRDGKLILATPSDRFPPRTARFDAPGDGPLIVVWAASSTPKAWRLTVVPAPLTDRAAPVIAERASGRDWLARYLAAELALQDRDSEGLEHALADAPNMPAFAALQARAVRQDPGRSRRVARDLARAAWKSARPLAPVRADLALGEIALASGEVRVAIETLERVAAAAPQASRVHRTLARAYLAADREDDAKKALADAERTARDRCALLGDRARLLDREMATDQRELAANLLTCKKPLEAAERYLELGLAEAALEAAELGKSERAQGLRIRALMALGRVDDARKALVGSEGPEELRLAADLALAEGDAAVLKAIVAEGANEEVLLDLVAAFPEWSEFASLMLDSETAIKAFEAEPPLPGPAVRVLDHSVVLYFADGESLRWVHEILAIRSRDAAEVYGEIGIPDDARLLRLYTRKADGRRLFGEAIPEKDSISLPDLESGDYVVAEYLEPGDNGYLYDSGYLSPRVFFRGVDLPTFMQRFEAYSPDKTPPATQSENGAPAGEAVTLGDRAGRRFESKQAKTWPSEPGSVTAARWLPWARVGQGVELEDDLAYLRDRALGRRRRTAAFDSWAHEAAGKGAEPERIKRLARAVREQIDDQSGLIDNDVPQALASGQGNRALVLSAALEALGIEHRLLTARRRSHIPDGPFLSVSAFAYPLIETRSGIVDPGPQRAAPGFFPFPLVGGDAVVIWPTAYDLAPIALPNARQVGERRTVTVEAEWAEDGTLTGEVEDVLVGQESIVVGHYLSQLSAEERPRLYERLLVGAFGATRVTWSEDPSGQDPDGPLVLRYRFEIEAGEQLAMGLFAGAPGRNYASVTQRTTALEIVLPTHQTVKLRLRSARDMKVDLRPGIEVHGEHRFQLKADVDDDELEVEARLDLAGGVIAPEDYEGFAKWARAVDPRERIRITR